MNNSRERVLAILVGIIVVGGLGYQFVNWAVVQPIVTSDQNLKKATERRNELAAKVQGRSRTEKEWLSKASFTLALSGKDAGHRFSRDLEQLLDQSGLSEGRSIAVLAEQRLQTSGYVEQPVAISVKGSVEELTKFLEELYRRPYPVRVRSLSVNPEEQSQNTARAATPPARTTTAARTNNSTTNRDRRPGAAGNPPRNNNEKPPPPAPVVRERPAHTGTSGADTRVVINLTATTLVIPPFKGFKHTALDDDPSTWPEGAPRLARDHAAYLAMASANQFTKWRPPPPVERPTPTTSAPAVATTKPDEHRTVARVDPRKDADKKIIVAVTSLHGNRIAYVRDETSRTGETEQFRASEPLDDGTLLLIHPHGLIVRVARDEEGAKENSDGPDEHATIDYWYPLGKSFKDREVFEPDSHPEVATELARVSDI